MTRYMLIIDKCLRFQLKWEIRQVGTLFKINLKIILWATFRIDEGILIDHFFTIGIYVRYLNNIISTGKENKNIYSWV